MATKNKITTKWLNGMAFESEIDSHKIIIDASKAVGGENKGPKPKPLMLTALTGCTGMDVISILKKMKITPTEFNIHAEADLAEEHPKKYLKIHLIYEFKGKNLDRSKLEKAVKLSDEKYCGVNAIYKEVIEMSYEIKIIEEN